MSVTQPRIYCIETCVLYDGIRRWTGCFSDRE
jgi:hypothetical protein